MCCWRFATATTRWGRIRSRSPTTSPRGSRSRSGNSGSRGRRRTVVGIVENPRDLGDEFALVSPSSAGAADYVTVLVDAGAESLHAFMQSADRQELSGRSALVGVESRPNSQGAKALAMFSIATVFLLLDLARGRHWFCRHRAATASPARHARCDRRNGETGCASC